MKKKLELDFFILLIEKYVNRSEDYKLSSWLMLSPHPQALGGGGRCWKSPLDGAEDL